MIEAYVPFLLILMSWQPDDAQATMSVSQRMFLDQVTCEAAGEETAALVAAQPSRDRQFAWVCKEAVREIEIYRPLRVQP